MQVCMQVVYAGFVCRFCMQGLYAGFCIHVENHTFFMETSFWTLAVTELVVATFLASTEVRTTPPSLLNGRTTAPAHLV